MNTHQIVRQFRSEDQDQARTLILEGLKEHFGKIRYDLNPDLNDIAASYLKDNSSDFFVIEFDGQIVATSGVLFERPGEARMVRVSVGKANRRQGLSTALLSAVESLYRSRGVSVLWAETNLDWVDAIGFYTSMGFREVIRNHEGLRLRREINHLAD